MAGRPALLLERALVQRAGPGARARLERVLAAATPAATGVHAEALLLVRRLRLAAPLSAPPDRAGTALVEQLRQRRRAPGPEDLYLPHPDEAELLLVGAALAGTPPHPLLTAHLPDAASPRLRWRRLLLPDAARLPGLVARLAEAGHARWLAGFEAGELLAATRRLLPGATAPVIAPAATAPAAAPTSIAPPPAIAAALAEAARAAPGLPPAAIALIAAARLARCQPHLLGLPAVHIALTRAAQGDPPAIPTTPPPAGPADPMRPRTARPAANAEPPQPPMDAPAPATAAPPEAPSAAPATASPAAAAAPQATPLQPLPEAPPEARLRSDFAGLFFLLPAFTALDLYGDFTRPHVMLPGLSPFALLWWLGRHWRGRRFLADPLAPWLRDAAGLAPHEPVSRWFQPPEPLPPHRWLAGLATRLHARLALATGHRRPLALLLAQPGTLIERGEHITLAFPLAHHPLPLRLAGLDRDPGYLPAAGRSIGFEFPC